MMSYDSLVEAVARCLANLDGVSIGLWGDRYRVRAAAVLLIVEKFGQGGRRQ